MKLGDLRAIASLQTDPAESSWPNDGRASNAPDAKGDGCGLAGCSSCLCNCKLPAEVLFGGDQACPDRSLRPRKPALAGVEAVVAPQMHDRDGNSDDGHSRFAYSPCARVYGVDIPVAHIRIAHTPDIAHLPGELQERARGTLLTNSKRFSLNWLPILTPPQMQVENGSQPPLTK